MNAPTGLERLLPQDLDAERATLGSMIQDGHAIGEVVTALHGVGAPAFARESHQLLYAVLASLYEASREPDGVVIREELRRRGQWEKVGEYDFLASLLGSVPSAARAAEYAAIVYDKYLLRQLVGATHRVLNKALDNDRPAAEVLDFADKEIFDVTERRIGSEPQRLAEIATAAVEAIRVAGERPTFSGEPTGFRDLDELTNGFQPGELIIIAGRPSMGKTALGLNIAEHMAMSEGRAVLFFSLEMSRRQLAQRILCSRARANAHMMHKGRATTAEMDRLTAAAQQLGEAPLLIDDSADLTIMELRARVRTVARRQPLRAIFVDYLQLMRSPRSENRQVEVSAISRGLKALAKDMNVPVIAMSQLNRSPEGKERRGNRPRMSDLRESGAIEQDADVVALLHREAYYKAREEPDGSGWDAEPSGEEEPNESIAELIIAKQRNGPTDTIRLHFSRAWTRFDNLTEGGLS